MPATTLTIDEYDKCLHALETIEGVEFIVASGSLPPGFPGDIFSRLSEIARVKKAKLVIDVPGEALVKAFKEKIFLLKPNLAELSFLAGVEKVDAKDAERVARLLIQKNSCDMIVVSLGSAGAIMVTAVDTYLVAAPAVERKSTVGAGDSMVAGIVLALSKGMRAEQALQYGVACGTAATMNEGTQLCIAEDVKLLFEYIKEHETPTVLSQV
jgi:6-phosphofructokinase 2